MYQLYYYPLNASMAPHFMLEELGVDYELLLVDRKSEGQKSAEYLQLNPSGRIPTLVHGDLVLTESPAICIHLAEEHSQKQLIPAVGTAQRAHFFQWMMYLTNTVQAELMLHFYPERHIGQYGEAAGISRIQEQRVTDMLQLLDKALKDKNYLLGEQVYACDYFLFMLAAWADEFERPPLSFEYLASYLKRLAKRETVVKVCDKEGLSLVAYQ